MAVNSPISARSVLDATAVHEFVAGHEIAV
jgi:hypothetical protein